MREWGTLEGENEEAAEWEEWSHCALRCLTGLWTLLCGTACHGAAQKILQGKSCQPNVASCSGIDIFLNQEYRERTGTLLTLLGMEPRVSGCEKRKWSIPQWTVRDTCCEWTHDWRNGQLKLHMNRNQREGSDFDQILWGCWSRICCGRGVW